MAALEKELARYYRLSQALYDAIVVGGDAAAIRVADHAVRDSFDGDPPMDTVAGMDREAGGAPRV